MKVAIIGPAHPLRGGIAHHVYWLNRELNARNHTSLVISYKQLYPQLLFPGKTTFDESNMKLDVQALAVLNPLRPWSWWKAAEIITQFKPDIVLIQWWNPFFAPLVGVLTKILKYRKFKIVLECHNVLPHERSLLDLPLLQLAFSSVDRFITHSASDHQELSSLRPGSRIEITGLPSLVEFASNHKKNRDGRTILFFGFVRAYKGLKVLLEAMPKVLEHVKCNLLIVGEFLEPEEPYSRLASDLGIKDSIAIQNRYIANEEIAEVFSQADVLVLPYLSATQSAVAQIAFRNGLPMIASRTGGLAEVIEEGIDGLLVPPGDPAALAGAIVAYFQRRLGPLFADRLASRSSKSKRNLIDVIERLAAN